MTVSKFDAAKLQEQLEILAGTRDGDKKGAAIRIEDCKPILELLPKLQTQTITAAPTQSNFNSLLKDVKAISDALNAFALAIQKRQIR